METNHLKDLKGYMSHTVTFTEKKAYTYRDLEGKCHITLNGWMYIDGFKSKVRQETMVFTSR